MNDFNTNYYTIIIAILSAIVSVISLIISWISYRSDRYKLKSKYSFGIGTGGLEGAVALNIEIFNTGKRPTTISAVRFYVTGGKQIFFFDNSLLYIQAIKLPLRLDENESIYIMYNLRYLVGSILEQNEQLEYIGIDTQDGKLHKIPVGSKEFKKMISFVSK